LSHLKAPRTKRRLDKDELTDLKALQEWRLVASYFDGLMPIHCSKCGTLRQFRLLGWNLLSFAELSHLARLKCATCGHEQTLLFREDEIETYH